MNVTISTLLEEFSSTNRLLQGKWSNVLVTSSEYREPQSVKNCLELCEYVCNDAELKLLRNGKNMAALALKDLASNIGKRAFMEMWTLEGANAIAMATNNVSLGSRGEKPTYLAVGKRVRVYKQELCKHFKCDPRKFGTSQAIIDRPADLGWKL